MLKFPLHFLLAGSLLGCAGLLPAPSVWAEPTTLASEGKARVRIELPADASDNLKASARRLTGVLSEITGASFEEGGEGRLILGLRKDHPELLAEVEKDETSTWQERYRLLSKGGNLYLIGETDLAVSHAVADLLRRVGYRHFFPPKAWEVVPHTPELKVEVDITEEPLFATRLLFQGYSTDKKVLNALKWSRHVSAFGAWRRQMRAFSAFRIRTGHAWLQMIRRHPEAFEANPQWLVPGGEDWRKPETNKNVKFQLEHPELVKLLVEDSLQFLRDNEEVDTVSVDPSDGAGWAEKSPLGSPSDQVVFLANAVSKAVREKFPTKKVAFYAYHLHSPPPTLELEPGVIVNVATGFIRGGYTVEALMKGWKAKGAELGIRDYTNVFFGSFDLPGGRYHGFSPEASYTNIRRFYEDGARYWISEVDNGWGTVGLGTYTAFETLWNPKTGPTPEAIREDFYLKAFGKGREAMRRYYDLVKPENHPLVSEDLAARMYEALQAALKEELLPAERTRILHLVAYTRFVELMHAYRNAEQGSAQQEAYRRLMQWAYDAVGFGMFDSRSLALSLPRGDAKLFEIRDEVFKEPIKEPSEAELEALLAERLKEVKKIGFEARTYSANLLPVGKDIEGASAAAPDFQFAQRQRVLWRSAQPGDVLALEVRALGKRPDDRPLEVAFLHTDDPNNAATLNAEVPADGQWQKVKFEAPLAGVYEISALTHGGHLEMRWPEGVAVVVPTGQIESSTLHGVWSGCFYVPPGVERIGGYSERPKGRLVSPEGRVLADFGKEHGPGYFDVAIEPSSKGRVFEFREAVGRKILMTVPPYLARRGTELLTPEEAGVKP